MESSDVRHCTGDTCGSRFARLRAGTAISVAIGRVLQARCEAARRARRDRARFHRPAPCSGLRNRLSANHGIVSSNQVLQHTLPSVLSIAHDLVGCQ